MQKHWQLIFLPFVIVFFEIAIFLSNDMYLPSMPAIAHELALTDTQVKATLTAWFLGASSIQVILGPLSDRYGRKIILILGAICFIIASYVCAVTHDLTVMLSARFFQGLSLCSMVAAYAAVHEIFSTKKAIKILALMGSISILAPALGPLGGSLIVQFADWRDIFWLFVIMGLISLLSLICLMPETNFAKHPLRFRSTAKDYFKILTNSRFMLPNLAYSFMVGIFFFWMFESPFIIMETYQKSAVYYGFSQTLIFSCFFIGALITKVWLCYFSVVSLIRTATVLSLLATATFCYVAKFVPNIDYIIILMMLVSLTTSILFGPINRVAIEAATQPMGRRTAIFSTTISLFGALSGWILSFIQQGSIFIISELIFVCMLIAALMIFPIDGDALKHEDD